MILSSKWLGRALCLLLCSSALAEPAAPTAASAREQARVAKQQNALGLKLFKQGDYQGAINAFWAAYQAKQAPQLLFSIAQANRLKGELVAARDLYQRFLSDAPDSPLRVEAETQLAAVRATLAEKAEQEAAARRAEARAREEERARLAEEARARAALTTSPSSSAVPAPKPFYKKPWFYGVVGGAVAVTALGLGLGLGLRQTDPATDLGFRPVGF